MSAVDISIVVPIYNNVKKAVAGLSKVSSESNTEDKSTVPIRDFALCVDMIVSGIAYACGCGPVRTDKSGKNRRDRYAPLKRKLARCQKEISELHKSQAYRVGMFVTWPLRKAKGVVRHLMGE